MSDDSLGDRRKELEESFFRKQNNQLLEKMKAEKQRALDKEGIARVSGITQDEVLERLVALKLNAETLAAFTLYPMVDIAWADGAVDPKEAKAVLDAAEQSGTKKGSDAHKLLESWLNEPPPPAVRDAWVNYVQALIATLSAEDRALLKREVLGRARTVAEAAGGIMGIGARISKTEAAALKRLEQAFEK
jgi:hypothetical protein